MSKYRPCLAHCFKLLRFPLKVSNSIVLQRCAVHAVPVPLNSNGRWLHQVTYDYLVQTGAAAVVMHTKGAHPNSQHRCKCNDAMLSLLHFGSKLFESVSYKHTSKQGSFTHFHKAMSPLLAGVVLLMLGFGPKHSINTLHNSNLVLLQMPCCPRCALVLS